ncbi:hypothetical protein FXO38_10759 [Capsicum annuum]|uniref:Disease resistance RPP13-like protein 1 n=1 Tax=Capsicum annuum TaxID=4072 RepID=A0A2G3AKR3_CAPAN|nr:hypothetical protein FXO37_15739 [Capsicum annuum]KAF3663215.1 hypothetical protein FXO38_10759 [Capsicum annuum]PHT94825.1 hypothetical protein T459_02707 [Capsicum annuum]
MSCHVRFLNNAENVKRDELYNAQWEKDSDMEAALVHAGCSAIGAFLQVLFDRMATRDFLNLFRGRKRDTKILKKLQTTLKTLSIMLDDAETREMNDEHVKGWLDDLKDVVCCADDLLDEVNTEALRIKVEGETEVEQGGHTSQKGHQVSIINAKKASLRLPSTSLVSESIVIGRGSEIEKIINLLLPEDAHNKEIGVIPVVGLGGIGKTTLAQVVFNDERVKYHFNLRAWVCVSENYDALRITKSLLEEVGSSGVGTSDNFNMLQIKLRESLKGRKLLIILNDVWNEQYTDWDIFKNSLRQGAIGSKILVTTRSEKVALRMGSEPCHYLSPIGDEDSWCLFEKHAFVAGLLHSKLDVEKWEDVLISDIWNLPNDPNDILPALRLSYNYLPSHLKGCFVLLSIFPKNFPVEQEEMTRLWNANGLLQHPQYDKAIEDVGNQYFAELRVRFFFKRIGNNKFLMHDLVNYLAQCVSSKFCARLENNWQNYTPERVRHVSCLKADYDVVEKFKTLKDAKHLRTLVAAQKGEGMYYYWLLGNKFVQGLLPFHRSLRVLSLSKHRGITELPPSVIGNLKHLRLLDLSSTEILKLPGSVSTPYNLQMLLSGCAYLNELPEELGLENVVNGRDAASANLKDKKLNENLVMEWSDSDVEDLFSVRDTLDKLQPHMGLTRFPDLLGDDSFVNSETLHLESCNCCFLPALGQLSSMKFLTISKMDEIRNVGEEFYGYNAVIRPFHSLIFLKFEQMMAWERWKILNNGCSLVLKSCT